MEKEEEREREAETESTGEVGLGGVASAWSCQHHREQCEPANYSIPNRTLTADTF